MLVSSRTVGEATVHRGLAFLQAALSVFVQPATSFGLPLVKLVRLASFQGDHYFTDG